MRSGGQFIALLLLIGFIGAYFWWIVTVAAVIAAAWAQWHFWPCLSARIEADCRHDAAHRSLAPSDRPPGRRAARPGAGR